MKNAREWTRPGEGRYSALRIQLLALLAALATCAACSFAGGNHRPRLIKDFSGEQDLKDMREIRANIHFSTGRLELEALPDGDSRAYRTDVRYDENRIFPNLEAHGESALRFRFNLESLTRSLANNGESRAKFLFTRSVPLELRIKAAAGTNTVDLTHLKIRDLALLAGAGETELSISSPNPEVCDHVTLKKGAGEFRAVGLANLNFRDLTFEAGVGEAKLDLTGEWSHDASLDISVGVGQVRVVLPSAIGAEVHASKSLLSDLSLPRFRHEGSDVHRSENYDQVPHHLYIEIKSGVGSVEFRWE